MAFVKGEISDNIPYRGLLIGSFLLQIYNMLSMPQVFEQSLFLLYSVLPVVKINSTFVGAKTATKVSAFCA